MSRALLCLCIFAVILANIPGIQSLEDGGLGVDELSKLLEQIRLGLRIDPGIKNYVERGNGILAYVVIPASQSRLARPMKNDLNAMLSSSAPALELSERLQEQIQLALKALAGSVNDVKH